MPKVPHWITSIIKDRDLKRLLMLLVIIAVIVLAVLAIIGRPISIFGIIEINSKKDTSAPTVQGKNINTGTNYGQVGDNYFNEKELTERDKAMLLSQIDSLKVANSINTNCVLIGTTQNTNGGKIAAQIEVFLKSKGYMIQGSSLSFGTIKGVSISYKHPCIDIIVGVL